MTRHDLRLLSAALFAVALVHPACNDGSSSAPHDDASADVDANDVDASDDVDASTTAEARIYVTLVSHNEDTDTGGNPACLALFDDLEGRWAANRSATIAIADAVDARGAAWALQTDVEYLEIVREREGDLDNFLREIASRPSGRTTIDAHAHEGPGKNYADVANLVERVTGERNGVIGGFTSNTCSPEHIPPSWEKFRAPYPPKRLGSDLVATVLTLGASPGHRCDPGASGVWRPASHEDFYRDDPTQTLPTIGVGPEGKGFDETVTAVAQLLQDLRAGRLDPGLLYTASVTIAQCDFDLEDGGVTPDDVIAFIDAINALDDDSDVIRWATFPEILEIWRSEYGSKPSLYTDDAAD